MEQLLTQGVFEPKATPEQTQALERLETLLALIEGWVQTVVNAALGDRIPGAAALGETLRRRRATGGPAEQTFATLVGLELRPRKLREAAALWERLTQAAGVDARDAVWQHPDLLPGCRRPRRARPGSSTGSSAATPAESTRPSPNSSAKPTPATTTAALALWIAERFRLIAVAHNETRAHKVIRAQCRASFKVRAQQHGATPAKLDRLGPTH